MAVSTLYQKRNGTKLCTMKAIKESEKISLAECKKVMNSRGKKYTDEELLKIRNWIYAFTEITLQFLETKTDEEIKEMKNKFCKKQTGK